MIIGDLATYLTDGGQLLSTIFEARIRKKGVKVGKIAGVEERTTNPPPKRPDFDSSAFYRHNQS